MAFGTGSHATTQLCLEQLIHAIDRRRDERLRVLDMGCGSGILAISCKKLGADDVLAVDIDPIAVTTTRDNAIANQAEITTQAAAEPIVGPFDIVVANILSQPLTVLAPALARLVPLAVRHSCPSGRRDPRGLSAERATPQPPRGFTRT
jgi:ribosomal protein L11 methyltransferase